MKKTLFLLIALACSAVLSVSAQQQTAFPGAEGFGRYALGARGVSNPTVYHVTNLNDSGTGSLRDAVSKPGRIVVFDVAGVIHLKSRLIFSANSYVAGQSAPGDGVIVYGDGVSFSGANNLIVRYMRFYMGKEGSSGKDASGISNGSDMLFDHLSILWGLDENFSVNWDGKGTEPGNITIQHSIIGQGIMSHSAGGLIQTNNGVSIIGNLYIDNKTRNPKVKGLNQFVNNVVYNWDGSNGYILGDTEASSWAHLEGNYFICGPQSRSPFTRATKSFQIYHKGDFIDKDKDGTLNGYEAQDADYGGLTFQPDLNSFTGIPKPHPTFPILTAAQALDEVIASAGASLPARSAPDAYLIDQLRSYGTKGALILNESANGIYQNVGVVSEGKKAADADNDGMPDAWETAAGLNPNDAADAVAMASNGYLNIENYLAGIQAPQMPYVRCASYLKMDARTRNSIQLSWQNNAVESDAIELQQSTDGINYTSTTLAANATSHNVTGLAEETTYYFRLVTKKTGIEDSTPSEVLKASTQGTPKAPYACLNPSPGVGETTRFYTQVPFAWENETGTWGGEVTYTLYVGTSEGSLTQVAGGLTQTSYTYSAALTMETTYYWRVDATNTLGTTPGTVWNFKAGTSSFTASYIDIGTDYDGTPGSRITAQSGIKFSSAKEYTLAEGTSTEMKVKVSTGSTAMNNSNN
ncbi:MAG: hypothetical protein LBM06_09485, partial [Prevotellaceae bacterium]|nr:hypothetical protein [Prevotellaceae bacterium]